MCFIINVYPINIDFIFVAKFDGEIDFFTLLLNDINLLIVLHIKPLLKHKTGMG